MKMRNVGLRESAYENVRGSSNPMTMEGVINKTFILLVLLFAGAFYTWTQFFQDKNVTGLLLIGCIGAFAVSLVAIFAPVTSPVTAPIYAVLEGLALGGISASAEARFGGIVIEAVIITFSVMIVMLILYRTRVIKATEKFKSGVIVATAGIALTYLVDIILNMFGMSIPFINQGGWSSVIFSLIVIGIASLNLILDFDFIETQVRNRSAKHMEWYSGFGLMVSLVWLYLEVLKFLRNLKK